MKTITKKSLLYKSKVEYMSGEGVYAMNHVLGCSHGCKYPCYAYLTAKRFGQVESYGDWCEPKLVENTLELLEKELDGHLRCLGTDESSAIYIQRVELSRGDRVLGRELEPGGGEDDAYRVVQDIAFKTPPMCIFALDPDVPGWVMSVRRAGSYEIAREALLAMQPRIREALKPLGVKARFGGVKEPIKRVHMCFTTDPFPYVYDASENIRTTNAFIHTLTMRAIHACNERGIPVTVLTKGTLPYWDEECGVLYDATGTGGIGKGTLHSENEYGISLSSLDESFRLRWEPGSATYAERIASLKAMHDAGCKTWVSMEPWPSPKIVSTSSVPLRPSEEQVLYRGAGDYLLRHLIRALNEVSFADRIVFGRWNYGQAGDWADYYRDCARIVRDFCAGRSIECVIKEGTE